MTTDTTPLPAISSGRTVVLPAMLTSDGFSWRLGIFGVAILALYQFLYLLLEGGHAASLSAENGPIEILEALLAGAASVVFFVAARLSVTGRSAMTLCGCLLGYAAARESDVFLEYWLFDDAYKYLVGLPLAVLAAVVVYHHRSRFRRDSLWLMKHPAAVLYVIAGIYLGGVCQIFDRPGMWMGITSPTAAVAVKATIEEFSELFGYLLFAFSAAEIYILARSTQILAIDDAVQPVAPPREKTYEVLEFRGFLGTVPKQLPQPLSPVPGDR